MNPRIKPAKPDNTVDASEHAAALRGRAAHDYWRP